jgi:hypothetical protein
MEWRCYSRPRHDRDSSLPPPGQSFPPIVEKLVDSEFASRWKPMMIAATITLAINPYSRAVTARRSVNRR